MTNDQSEYEIFISYARLDNQPIPLDYPQGWVSALVEQIRADHRQFETSPLRIFFDTAEIKDMDDWRNRILGALRRSKVLLICLSPNYFKSEPCKWEWDEYLARQHQKLVGSEPHATVYFVEVVGANEQENAQRLESVMGKNFTDLRPYFPRGAAVMQEEAVRQKMAALGESVWERLKRSRRALSVPGKLRGMTPYFVGRNREIAELHRLVGVGKIGLVTAVHGMGGLGKTELAVAYARGYADCYPLGLWQLEAEHHSELLPLIGTLGLMPEFGYTVSEGEKNNAELLGRGVLMELARRAEQHRANDNSQAPAVLLILDNVSETALLGAKQLAQLPKADWLRIIATTRFDPGSIDPAKKQIDAVEVESLDPENALRLIVDHLPEVKFRNPEDECAAREIVRELGGFTLAVEQVAVFLGLNHECVSPSEYLHRLRAEGLHGTDTLVDAPAEEMIQHQIGMLKPILDSMLDRIGDDGRTLLRFAAHFPAESIPLQWLKELTIAQHPHLGQKRIGHPDPWLTLLRQVQGLRFFRDSAETEFVCMHRLIASRVQQSCGTPTSVFITEQVLQHRRKRADVLMKTPGAISLAEAKWMGRSVSHFLDAAISSDEDRSIQVPLPLKNAAASWSVATKSCDDLITNLLAISNSDYTPTDLTQLISLQYTNLSTSKVDLLTNSAKATVQHSCDAFRTIVNNLDQLQPSGSELEFLLSSIKSFVSGIEQTDYLNDFKPQIYEMMHIVISRILQSSPDDGKYDRDFAMCANTLGNLALSRCDYNQAIYYYEHELSILTKHAAIETSSIGLRRYVAECCFRLGDLTSNAGNHGAARHHYERVLSIVQNAADAERENEQLQLDLFACLNRAGDASAASNDWLAAKSYFVNGLAIISVLAKSGRVHLQRDLADISVKIGDISTTIGDLKSATQNYQNALHIIQELVNVDSHNIQLLRYLATSCERLADNYQRVGDQVLASYYYRQSLAERSRIHELDPTNLLGLRDLMLSNSNYGQLLIESSDIEEARNYIHRGYNIAVSLVESDGNCEQFMRDLVMLLSQMARVAKNQSKDGDSAAIWWSKFLDAIEVIKCKGFILSPGDLQFVDSIKKHLGTIS